MRRTARNSAVLASLLLAIGCIPPPERLPECDVSVDINEGDQFSVSAPRCRGLDEALSETGRGGTVLRASLRKIRQGTIRELSLALPDVSYIEAMTWLTHAFSANKPKVLRFGAQTNERPIQVLMLELGGHDGPLDEKQACQLRIWDFRGGRVTEHWAAIDERYLATSSLLIEPKPDIVCPIARDDRVQRCSSDVLAAADDDRFSEVQAAVSAAGYDGALMLVARRRPTVDVCDWLRDGNLYHRGAKR